MVKEKEALNQQLDKELRVELIVELSSRFSYSGLRVRIKYYISTVYNIHNI